MELWTTFILGLMGSLHCAGMCGPLALALPAAGSNRAWFLAGRVAYNTGRIVTYSTLGIVVGLVGQSLALAGLQRWLSLLAGGAILTGLFASSRILPRAAPVNAVTWLKSRLGSLLHRRGLSASFTLGLVNGLLPCGLVYVACAAATATGSVLTATAAMVTFGLGTVPMMLALGLAGARLQPALRFRLQRLLPASLLVVGLLLVVRGLALGIPYLSPELLTASPHGRSCH